MRKATHRFRCLYLIIPLALVTMQLFGFFPCPPVIAAPVLSIVPSSGTVGTPVTVTGTVFDSYDGDTIHILFDDTEISTVVIPSNGSFIITAAVPAGAGYDAAFGFFPLPGGFSGAGIVGGPILRHGRYPDHRHRHDLRFL